MKTPEDLMNYLNNKHQCSISIRVAQSALEWMESDTHYDELVKAAEALCDFNNNNDMENFEALELALERVRGKV